MLKRSFMYLRPGNLYKDFRIERLEVGMASGFSFEKYEDKGEHLKGVRAEAGSDLAERMKHRWDQEQHALTHTFVTNEKPDIKKGDRLIFGERSFFVLTVDDVGGLGIAGIVYLEERNDVK